MPNLTLGLESIWAYNTCECILPISLLLLEFQQGQPVDYTGHQSVGLNLVQNGSELTEKREINVTFVRNLPETNNDWKSMTMNKHLHYFFNLFQIK